MANGAFNFKNNSGNIVSFISGSGSDIIISGGTLNLSNMTGLTLGNLTMEGTVETASFAPSYLLTSSFNTYSGTTNTVIGTLQTSTASLNTRISTIEGVTGSYATTGSNIFKSSQTITGSLFVSENLVIAGSSSIQYISSSIVNIDDNIITVNAMNPSVRFGGLSVIDSGSSPQVSGSMLFDSINNQWIFVHQNQSSVTSSVLLMGPETYDNLGNEAYITANRLVKSTGIEHLSDSNITDTGTKVSINSNTEVTGSLIGTSTAVFGSSVTATSFEVGNGQYFKARRSSSNLLIDLLGIESGTDNTRLLITGDLNIKNGSLSTLLNMTTTGAATFSSSVADYAATITNVQDSSQGLLVRATDNDTTLYLLNLQSSNGSTSQTWVDRFVVTKSGNVGIGTSSPSTTFNVGHESHGIGISYLGSSALPAIAGLFTDTSSGQQGYGSLLVKSRSDYAGYSINFYTAASNNTPLERMRINSTGNVGIGTTSPSWLLVVNKDTNATASGQYPAISVNNPNASGYTAYYFHSGSTNKGGIEYSNSTNDFMLFANGAERIRIVSNGSVLIGTTTDSGQKFQVNGNGRFNNNAAGAASLSTSNSNSSDDAAISNLNFDGNRLRLGVLASDSSYGCIGTNGGSTGLAFVTHNGTSWGERMRLLSGGYVYINTTSNPLANATPQLGIIAGNGTDAISIKHTVDGNNSLNIWQTGTSTHSAIAFYKGNSQNIQGVISVSTSATSYTSSSDYRLKTNIVPIENGINRLMQLKPSKFNWIESGEESEGFIAHELQEIFPYAVIGEKDDVYTSTGNIKPQSVDYGRITPLLVKAIQELKVELEIAKTEIQTLKQ
jgi:hypothetical protein